MTIQPTFQHDSAMEVDKDLLANNFDVAPSFSVSDDQSDTDHLRAVDRHFSEEQIKLSYYERNYINEEIHGVASHVVEETPELIRSSLNQLAYELHELVQLDHKKEISISSSLSSKL